MGLTLLFNFGDAVAEVLENILGVILWGFCDIFFLIINLCEAIFRKFAGLETLTINGETVEGDIVLYLLQSNIVQEVFFSILILSLFLLIIFTIFAIVKNQYAEKQKPVMGIINNSVKGLLQYLMVPVCVVVGLAVGNAILRIIDEGTRTQTDGSASDMLFIAAAYNANELRRDKLDSSRQALVDWIDDDNIAYINVEVASVLHCSTNKKSMMDAAKVATREQLDEIAYLVDEYFVGSGLDASNGALSKWAPTEVTVYYDMFEISYITIWVGGGFMIYALVTISWGLIGRMFKMVLSYCLTPAFIAMYPIDEGKALKSWIGDFSKNATSAYVAVAILNIFYSILPFVRNIQFFGGGLWNPVNLFIQLLITISGYLLVKDMIKTVSGWVGTGDAFSEGKSTSSALTKPLMSGVGKVSGAFVGMKAGAKAAGDAGNNKFFGAMVGAYKGAGLDSKFDPTKPIKAMKDAEKGGKEYYKTIKTTFGTKDWRDANQARFDVAELAEKERKAAEAKEKEFKNILSTKIADVENQYASGAISEAEKNAEIAKLNSQYNINKLLSKYRASQSIGQMLTSARRDDLEKRTKAFQKQQTQIAPAEKLVEAYYSRDDLDDEILGGYSGANKNDVLKLALAGDVSGLTGQGVTDTEANRMIQTAQQQLERRSAVNEEINSAFRAAEKLAASSDDARKELEKIFTFDTTGKVVSRDSVNIKNKYEQQLEEIQKQSRALEAEETAIKGIAAEIEKRAQEGGLTPDEMKELARKLKDSK